jgi:hypothetical protein
MSAIHKRSLVFSSNELKNIFISILVNSIIFFMFFIVTFFKHYQVTFQNILFLSFFILCSVSAFMFSVSVIIKYFSLAKGYFASYTPWNTGLLSGLVISFLSYGFVPLAFFGSMRFDIISRLRYGRIHVGENKRELQSILLFTYSMLFTSILFLNIISLTQNAPFLFYFLIIVSIMTFLSLLPFKNSLGVLFFFSQYQSSSSFRLFFPFLVFSIFLLIAVISQMFIATLLAICLTPLFFVFLNKIKRLAKKK